MEKVNDFIRPIIQSFAKALPAPVREVAVNVLGEQCYSTLLEQVDLQSSKCIKFAISKALGVGIIAGGSFVKIPQILKLLNARSGRGISFSSYLLETIAYAVSLAYNVRLGFPFSTFGETALIAIQNIVIMVLVLHYTGKDMFAAGTVAAAATGIYTFFFSNAVSLDWLSMLQATTIPVTLFAKIPQILNIQRNKSTGQLSAFAVFNYLFGSVARLFTTLQEVDDRLILWSVLGATLLNAVLVAQMLYYWNSLPKGKSGRKKVR